MKIRMNIDGVLFELNITDYRKSVNKDELDEWSKTDLLLKSRYLSYHIDNDEILLVDEIEEIRDNLKLLLDGKMDEKTEMSFIEPDISLVLFPNKNIINPLFARLRGKDPFYVQLEMKVNIWDEVQTGNSFSMILDRQNIENLKTYLELITGEIDYNDKAVRKMIKSGILVE